MCFFGASSVEWSVNILNARSKFMAEFSVITSQESITTAYFPTVY